MSGCVPIFYQKAKKNEFKSKEAGKPVFEDFDYVKIIIPGDRNLIIERKVTEGDMADYPRQWEAYKAGREQRGNGMPIREWPQVTAAQVETLVYFGVTTVEELSSLSDATAKDMGPGFIPLRDLAKKYISGQNDAAAKSKMQNEIDVLKAQIAELTRKKEEPEEEEEEEEDTSVADTAAELSNLQGSMTDSRGAVFDPKVHAVDEQGIPVLTKFKTFKKV